MQQRICRNYPDGHFSVCFSRLPSMAIGLALALGSLLGFRPTEPEGDYRSNRGLDGKALGCCSLAWPRVDVSSTRMSMGGRGQCKVTP
jgi:hypothetical protein